MTRIRTPGRAGFTLVELMIVVVVVGILAAVAVPRFTDVALESRRAEADPILRQIFTLQERYRARTGAYATDLAALEGGTIIPEAGEYFRYALAAHASGYCAVATPTREAAALGLQPKSLDAARRFHRSADCS